LPELSEKRGGEVSATKRQAEPEFQPKELYETLLRIKRDQPRRYQLNVSVGMQRCVESYEALKREHEGGRHGHACRR
jgi:hypothetical protein